MKKRLFVGVPVGTDVQQAAQTIRQHTQSSDAVRWTPQENLHVTICFLGNVSADEILELSSELKSLEQQAAFSLRSNDLRVLHKRGGGMFWLEFEKSTVWNQFVNQTREICQHYWQQPPQHQEQQPHLTLARFKGTDALKAPSDVLAELEVPVSGFNLYESQLLPQGVRYIPLAKFHLTL